MTSQTSTIAPNYSCGVSFNQGFAFSVTVAGYSVGYVWNRNVRCAAFVVGALNPARCVRNYWKTPEQPWRRIV